MCRTCAGQALESRLQWIEARLAVGGCIDCLRKAKRGSRRCGRHEKANREYQRRYDERRRGTR